MAVSSRERSIPDVNRYVVGFTVSGHLREPQNRSV
jgi:hypothetical protein